jgi:hypothetical protein
MRHRAAALAAAVGALAFGAAPAHALISGPGVRAGHNISVFATIDFISAFGYSVGNPMTIDVVRNGHRVASVTAPTVATPDGGALEVNHGPLGPPQPGDCWAGFTPDIRPGDVIRVTADGGTDEVTADNVRIDQGPTGAPGGAITMKGVAAHADGTPIAVADLASGEVRNLSQFRASPDVVERTPGTADGWTATFNPPFNVTRNRAGLNPSTQIMGADVLLMGFGHIAPLPLETQMAEGVGETPGPALGCEGSPAAVNAVGVTSVKSVNADMLAAGAPDAALELSGPAGADVASATIALSDGTTSVTAPAAGLAAGATQHQAWSATFTKAQLASLADGNLTASGSFAGGFNGAIVKDTVAPVIKSDLAPGSYVGLQKVTLDAPGAARVAYQLDGGSEHTFTGTPIDIGAGTHTLSASAVDAAGNRSTASFAYTIDEVPVAGGPIASRPVAAPVAGTPVVAPSSRSLRIASLRLPAKVRRADVRRRGLRIAMRLARGTQTVRISVYRRTGGGFRLAARAVRVPGKGGSYTVRLRDAKARRALSRRGSYLVEVTPAGSGGRMSDDDTRSRAFRVI